MLPSTVHVQCPHLILPTYSQSLQPTHSTPTYTVATPSSQSTSVSNCTSQIHPPSQWGSSSSTFSGFSDCSVKRARNRVSMHSISSSDPSVSSDFFVPSGTLSNPSSHLRTSFVSPPSRIPNPARPPPTLVLTNPTYPVTSSNSPFLAPFCTSTPSPRTLPLSPNSSRGTQTCLPNLLESSSVSLDTPDLAETSHLDSVPDQYPTEPDHTGSL